jgi:hypothetical protein
MRSVRRASTPLPPLIALPLAFWACGGTGGGAPVVDAGAGAGGPPDAGMVAPDAAAGADADVVAMDAGEVDAGEVPDAGMFAPDASAVDAGPPDSGVMPCRYPAGAIEPMTLDEVMSPYRWPRALDGAGAARELDLERAFCADDPATDWAASDVILFVTAPAW